MTDSHNKCSRCTAIENLLFGKEDHQQECSSGEQDQPETITLTREEIIKLTNEVIASYEIVWNRFNIVESYPGDKLNAQNKIHKDAVLGAIASYQRKLLLSLIGVA